MLVLIRIGAEVTLKSARVRARFQQKLKKNIAAALRGVDHQLSDEWSRFFLELEAVQVLERLNHVAGIASYSPIDTSCAPEVATIVAQARDFYRTKVVGKSFAVRAKRRFAHQFSSAQVTCDVGAALLPYAARVDLSNPDITINIEIRARRALFFTSTVKGQSGLPLGTGGHAVSLISGGFDSAVASFLMYNRGLSLDFVFCNLHGGRAHELSVLRVVDALCKNCGYGDTPRVFCVDFTAVLADLRQKVVPRYQQVLLKRLFYRSAALIAPRRKAQAIVTGEALGQVSSQTLSNLAAIAQATTLPVLRPLLGYNKEQIIALAQKINTSERSAHVREYCQLNNARPATAMSNERAAAEEQRLDLQLLETATWQARIVPVTRIAALTSASTHLQRADIPAAAVVIDCRQQQDYEHWHYPAALHHDFNQLLTTCHELPTEPTYVVYCEVGLLSTAIAERMQERGYDAYSLVGGGQQARQLAAATLP